MGCRSLLNLRLENGRMGGGYAMQGGGDEERCYDHMRVRAVAMSE